MQFLFPWFLAAAAAIAIPIIVHLFHFRRFKKVRFTNVRFLKEVKEETSNRSRLRKLLVLSMRCLALLALVAGFAQPFLPGNNPKGEGQQAVSIFIDNSFSMGALAQDQALLEQARLRARQIIEAYSANDQFQILSNAFEGRHQRLVSKEDALAFTDDLRTGAATRTLSQIIARQSQLLRTSKAPNKTAYVISDFQTSMADIALVKDTALDVVLMPLQSVEQRNVSVDSVWFSTPAQLLNQNTQLLVRMKNHGSQDADNVRLSYLSEGENKAVGLLNIPANSEITDTINISPTRAGWHKGSLIATDYPVQFDDTLHLTYPVDKEIPVLLVGEGGANKYLDAALLSINGLVVTRQNATALNYGAFSDYRLILLQDVSNISSGLATALKQFAESGGAVLVFPPLGADVNSYSTFLAGVQGSNMGAFESKPREVSQINTLDYIFRDVYLNQKANLRLPKTTGNYALRNAGSRGGESLLTYRDGTAFLVKNIVGNGAVYVCAAPLSLNYSNLVQSGEVFVPLLYKAAVSGKKAWKVAYTIAEDDYFEADNRLRVGGSDVSYKMKGATGELIPDQRVLGNKVGLTVDRQIEQAGFYDLYLKPDSVLATYGFNYNRLESDLRFLSAAELTAKSRGNIKVIAGSQNADLTGTISDSSRGIALWRWCLGLALLALLAEVLILRFWKA